MKNFYVYEYWRLDTNTCFYVGKGCKDRCFDISDRSIHFKAILNKTECAVVIVKDCLNEKESFELEKILIERYILEEGYGIDIQGLNHIEEENGHLVNKTLGGEGVSGYIYSKEQKLTISERVKGAKNPFYGKNHSDKTKAIISFANLGKKAWNKGKRMPFKTLSSEHKVKIGQSKMKPIVLLNTLEHFKQIQEAYNKYGVSNINRCLECEQDFAGRDINMKPLVWMYKDKFDKMSSKEINDILYKTDDRIICLNTKEIFKSILSAERKYNCKHLIEHLRGKQDFCGKTLNGDPLVWMYYKDYVDINENYIRCLLTKADKRIICLNNGIVYGSAREVQRRLGCERRKVTRCCKNEMNYINHNDIILKFMYYSEYNLDIRKSI